VLGLAFKLEDPDGLLGDEKELGITCALIPTDMEGITIGRRHFPLNIPFQNGPTQGKDVFVPLDYIIGGNAYLMDAVTTLSTGAIDLGEKPSVVSAISKYHLTEKMRASIIDAMDIHGGKGICMGPSNYLARGYQGAPIAITVEGANILTRSLIIYGQGAIRCHPYILAELEAANEENSDKALTDFDHALFGHIGFSISNISRSLWCSFTGARFLPTPYNDQTKHYYQLLSRFSSNLAMLSDIAMIVLGADLKRKERISARLGDVLSHLYLASACLKRFNDEGRQQDDLPLLQWAVEDSLYNIQKAIDELLSNFPNKWVAYLLRGIIFPFGTWLTKPSDDLDHQVAQLLQTPSDARNR
jgi:acyl-CoA dehydrogenase